MKKMKMSEVARLSIFLLLILLLSRLASRSCRAKSEDMEKQQVPLFVFGDSLFDAGNNNYINTTTLYQANFPPYGETYFKLPTGRFCNGRLISDFIAQYANLPLIPPFLQPGLIEYQYGVNFASGGGGALVDTHPGEVIDLKTQLGYYKKVEAWFVHKFGNTEARKKLSEAVYLFSIGGNDYLSIPLTNLSLVDSNYIAMVLGNLTTVMKEIYKSGGRKFAFTNMPDLGCLPFMRNFIGNGSCLVEASSIAKEHNKELSKLLVELEKQLKGFVYLLFDLNSSLQQRVENPSKYGFREGKSACCGSGMFGGAYSCGGKRGEKKYKACDNPNEYVFWDSYHSTEMTYKQLADQMWSGVGNPHLTGSYNMKQLFQLD
ncbi:GDSL esterase/lipase 5-like [Tripterygium wilfordii]|uniref:GDSL esterase/lipase 5-like n=1 Tax=Tripterygium wilfordii TaxID=458696 RepID=UPI0018F85F6C|nr:GDSL esterase/lipase 5-like [Tripterygium wilfordii]